MNRSEMMAWLKKCEGYNQYPYLDITKKVTIGHGRNLDDVGISKDEADYLLGNDLDHAWQDMAQQSWFKNQPECVQDALVNMCFNMGLTKLLTFNKMIAALKQRNYTVASLEALDSQWALQVGQRAKDIALMMREAI
jgi:lysozyme